MNDEVKLILTKLKIVSEEKENGAYICDKEHSKLLLSYIEQLENNRDKAIEYLEKSKLNQLDTYCKYLHIDFDSEKIENIDELVDILKGDSDYD